MGKDTRTPEQARADQKAQLESMHAQLTDAVEALVTGQDWREAVQFAARFRKRSAGGAGVFELREWSRLTI